MEKAKLHLSRIFIFIILSSFLLSCSSEDINIPQSIEEYNKVTTQANDSYEIDDIKEMLSPFPIDDIYNSGEAKASMASFVNSINEYYTIGMTYEEFKYAIDPHEGLLNIKPEGNILLKKGFNYITDNVNPSNMSGKYFVDAFFAGLSYYEESLTEPLDFNLITNKEYDLIFADLFGLDEDYIEAYGKKGGCKIFQFGCHAKWLVNTVVDWWNTPAIGDGGMTNGQVLAGIASVINGANLIVKVIIIIISF